ncbi:MAG: hypothetical protein ACXVEF_23965 [Polyangiales bacterium]
MSSRVRLAGALAALVLPVGCIASDGSDDLGCSADVADDGSCEYSAESLKAHAHHFDVGMSGYLPELPYLQKFRAAAGSSVTGPRLCHAYTYWDIARHDPPGGTGTHSRAGLIDWFAKVVGGCDEVMITFQGQQGHDHVEPLPDVSAFESAFVAFHALTGAGQPLAAWNGKVTYTAWNEPNNPAPSGNGLNQVIPPERAADYYLAARRHCAPVHGCKIAAGDLATNGATANDIEWNCANDGADNTTSHCQQPSPFNKSGKPPSYLDRYKHEIDRRAPAFGLKTGFRPEVFAYHPWHDVNGYIESKKPCTGYEDCTTRRLLQSLGGSWGGVEIWDTEIGVGLQTDPAPSRATEACGAAFLVRLTDLSPRITRVYYMRFGFGNGPLFDGGSLNAAGEVLAHHRTTGGKCAPTGIDLAI